MGMQIGQWQFRPGAIPTIATILILPLLISLGVWQLDRAEQKRSMYQVFLSHQKEPPINLNSEHAHRNDKTVMMWRHVNVAGEFVSDVNILLDNQILNGQAGYFIYTPFKLLDEDITVLVNRGWVASSGNRANIPAIDTPVSIVELSAVVKDVPKTGILLQEVGVEKVKQGIYRVQKINLDEISQLFGHELLPYIIRLEPESDHGFVRKWELPGSDEKKHLGYAFQWFALAITLVIIFIVVNTRKAV